MRNDIKNSRLIESAKDIPMVPGTVPFNKN